MGPRSQRGSGRVKSTPLLSVVNEDGSTEAGSLIDEIVREGARRMLAAALEAEVNQYIAELADQTDEAGRCLVVRNGHHRPRTVTTAAGPVEVAAEEGLRPGMFRLKLGAIVDEHAGGHEVLDALAPSCREVPQELPLCIATPEPVSQRTAGHRR